MSKKALFFDIDGTLLSEITHEVPKSAVTALHQARQNGHLIFINSGRVVCHIGQIRNLVETDGSLCGCGTYIEVKGQVLYHTRIPRERGIQIKKNIEAYGLDGILEAAEACYLKAEPSRFEKTEHLRQSLIRSGIVSNISWESDGFDFDKFCVLADEQSDTEGFFRSLEPDIQVIDRGDEFYECVPAGHSKATAIEFVLNHYGIPMEDAYVFGDSANDLPMFEYAKNAVLMGKHDQQLIPHASYITRTVEEDGVAHAMKELGII